MQLILVMMTATAMEVTVTVIMTMMTMIVVAVVVLTYVLWQRHFRLQGNIVLAVPEEWTRLLFNEARERVLEVIESALDHHNHHIGYDLDKWSRMMVVKIKL